MKNLTLIRHAKSSHDDFSLSDLERPLNARGQRAASQMAGILLQQNFSCDAIYCSPATRAQQTATALFQDSPLNAQLELVTELYTFDMEGLYRAIELIDDRIEHAAIVGHNAAITLLANDLTLAAIDNVPTCGIVHIRLAISRWVDILAGTGELVAFDYPNKFQIS